LLHMILQLLHLTFDIYHQSAWCLHFSSWFARIQVCRSIESKSRENSVLVVARPQGLFFLLNLVQCPHSSSLNLSCRISCQFFITQSSLESSLSPEVSSLVLSVTLLSLCKKWLMSNKELMLLLLLTHSLPEIQMFP
jgi:hypothetical protein